MEDIPLATIIAILKDEKNHRRLEELAADIFTLEDDVQYTTTSATGDAGRDAYSLNKVADGAAIVCATVTKRERLITKIHEDIDNLAGGTLSVRRLHYVCNNSLKETVRDELRSYASSKLRSAIVINVHGLGQIAERAHRRQNVFQNRYGTEIAAAAILHRRAAEDRGSPDGPELFRFALAATYHPELDAQRVEILQQAVLHALQDEKPRDATLITSTIAQQLRLGYAPRDSYIASTLKSMSDQGFLENTVGGFRLTALGRRAFEDQKINAASSSLDGRSIFLSYVQPACGDLSRANAPDRLWILFQERIAEKFFSCGLQLIQEIQSLAGSGRPANSLHEFRGFLTDFANEVQGLLFLLPGVKLAVVEALNRFTDPNEPGSQWFLELATKYIVLCSLGLDPKVEQYLLSRFKHWIVCPDTHMILSYLCPGDAHHSQCRAVLDTLPILGTKIELMEAIVEEAVHHADLAPRRFQTFCTGFDEQRRTNLQLRAIDAVDDGENAFVRAYAFLSGDNFHRGHFLTYIGQFKGRQPLDLRPMRTQLEPRLKAKTILDDEAVLADGRKYAVANATSAKSTTRLELDGRLLASTLKRSSTLEAGERLVIVTDHTGIRSAITAVPEEDRTSIVLSRPGTMACAMLFTPGACMSLETIKVFLFSKGRATAKQADDGALSRLRPLLDVAKERHPFQTAVSVARAMEDRLLGTQQEKPS